MKTLQKLDSIEDKLDSIESTQAYIQTNINALEVKHDK